MPEACREPAEDAAQGCLEAWKAPGGAGAHRVEAQSDSAVAVRNKCGSLPSRPFAVCPITGAS